MESNNNLILQLQKEGVLKSSALIQAFHNVKRSDFVSSMHFTQVYQDVALPIGYAQTNSQPTTVALMLELLGVKKGDKVLDLGSGSGWTTALLAFLVGEEGSVIGVERIPELVEFGRKNLSKYAFPNAKIEEAGKELGFKQDYLYDKILVSASAPIFPTELLDQLNINGTLVVPVRNTIIKAVKSSQDKISKEEYFGFVFVPLIV